MYQTMHNYLERTIHIFWDYAIFSSIWLKIITPNNISNSFSFASKLALKMTIKHSLTQTIHSNNRFCEKHV